MVTAAALAGLALVVLFGATLLMAGKIFTGVPVVTVTSAVTTNSCNTPKSWPVRG